MKIGEVVEYTGLTRKAVNYYEEQGLITPSPCKDNNYREYSREDVDRLVQISVLRQIDVPIRDIKSILSDPEKIRQVLESHLSKLENDIKKLEISKGVLRTCLDDLTADKVQMPKLTEKLLLLNNSLQMDGKGRENYMKKQLQRIFPGNFGKMIFFLYGTFLTGPVDTHEKEAAWMSIVKYLDEMESIEVSEDIKVFYENIPEEQLDTISQTLNKSINKVNSFNDEEFEDYIKQTIEKLSNNQSTLNEVKSFTNDSSKNGMGIKEKLREMGYYENFENNLKILSEAYVKYTNRMMLLESSLKSVLGIE